MTAAPLYLLRLLARGLGWCLLGLALAVVAGGLLVGDLALLIVLVGRCGKEMNWGLLTAVYCTGLIATFALAIAVHEGGHLLGGRIVGMTPRFAHVGPVTFTCIAGRWRTGWDWRRPWLGGFALCDLGPATRGRVALFVAAGPAANLALGIAALATAPALSALPQCWAGLFAVHSLFFGLASLVPLRERRVSSDGLVLWRLWLDGPTASLAINPRYATR